MITTHPTQSTCPPTSASVLPLRRSSLIPARTSTPPLPHSILPMRVPSILPVAVRTSMRPRPMPTLPPGVRAQKMMGTVRQVASRMARRLPRHIDVEDLVSAGALGLADAFSRRGAMPGSEFEAFASYRIRGAMLDELRRLDAMPRRERLRAKQVATAQRVVEQRCGAPAGEEQVAEELGLPTGDYQAVRTRLDAWRAPVPLAAPAHEDDDHGQEIPDVHAEGPEALVARADLGRRIAEGIHALPERQRHVLVGVYVEGQTLRDIGLELGVTESRVCQIHGEALAALRANVGDDVQESAPVSGVRIRATKANRAQVAPRMVRSRRA